MAITVQKIKKEFSQMEMAFVYYSVISSLNNLQLTTRQLQLLSFTAIRGSITNPAARKDFCQLYDTSQATIYNIISELRKYNLLVKEQNKIKVHPQLALDFNNEALVLQMTLIKKSS